LLLDDVEVVLVFGAALESGVDGDEASAAPAFWN
jgi:hypothetical protein